MKGKHHKVEQIIGLLKQAVDLTLSSYDYLMAVGKQELAMSLHEQAQEVVAHEHEQDLLRLTRLNQRVSTLRTKLR